MSAEPRHWFPAKRYGWGWGIPRVWQGWAVMASFLGLQLLGARSLLPGREPVAFILYSALLCALLFAICWVKGEPPRWRWGVK